MRNLLTVALFTLALALIGVACHRATAEALPSHMDPLDAARLQASLAELQRIDSEAKAASAPHRARAQEILQRYRIDPAALGKGVGVDFDSGEIKRQEPPTRLEPKGGAK